MVRISKLTDYGVLVMSYLAGMPGAAVSVNELSNGLSLPAPTVSKVLKSLTKSGLLKSHRGPSGGYSLNRAPDQITLMEIINVLEGPLALTECSTTNSQCVIESTCRLRDQWISINQFIYDSLGQIDLVKLSQGSPIKNLKMFKALDH